MAHWTKEECIAMGVMVDWSKRQPVPMGVCHRCGERRRLKEMAEIGNEVYVCKGGCGND
ncbi:MAG: hypothetical protein HUK20_01290 [Fibrobacter sp.]|nr:hypothetical protein [Fibrobacter sp.]